MGEVVHGLGSGDNVIGSKGVLEDGREIGDVGGDGSWAGHCRGCEMMCLASSLPSACFPTRFRGTPCRVKCFSERKFSSNSLTCVPLRCSFNWLFA